MRGGRRRFLEGALLAGTAAGVAGQVFRSRRRLADRRPVLSRVAVLNQSHYGHGLAGQVRRGIELLEGNWKGKRVLLKPNLVEVDPGVEINTRPEVVGAAIDAFLSLGAAEVVVGEGPGHQRDTMLVLIESGLNEELRGRRVRFVDLNRDEVVEMPNRSRFTELRSLWIPKAALAADVVVSMPKVKTHHWAGVTLSMKNMFGVMPGGIYGWPKNVLHWEGIAESILDICATAPMHLVIADGVVAMEGNGPLHGTHRALGKIVIADDPVAADFACCQLMGLRADRVNYLAQAARFLGNGMGQRVRHLAESPIAPSRPFDVVREFSAIQVGRV